MSWLMTKATTEQYRQATAEAIAFAIWMKRFAEARFKS
jgi:CRISPR/Cas system CMR-associated protein Cmr5 small subunit